INSSSNSTSSGGGSEECFASVNMSNTQLKRLYCLPVIYGLRCWRYSARHQHSAKRPNAKK
ncbi:unnamed protein product, partial [Ceratitis capitata]